MLEEADYHQHMPHLCTNASVFFHWHSTKGEKQRMNTQNRNMAMAFDQNSKQLWKKLYTINTKKIELATLTDVCLCRISDKSDAKFEKSKHTCRQTDPGPGALSSDKLFVSSNYENDAQAATSQLHLRHRTEFLKKETIPHNWPWNLVL